MTTISQENLLGYVKENKLGHDNSQMSNTFLGYYKDNWYGHEFIQRPITVTFASIDAQLSSYSSSSDAVNYLRGTDDSAGIIRNYCLANGSDPYSEGVYRYTSGTTGLEYQWDTINLTVAVLDPSQQAFSTTILWNNNDGWYGK